MANDHARDKSIRSGSVPDLINVLHDRIITAEETVDDACSHVTRETAEIRAEVDELRRLVVLFAGIALIALSLALGIGILYISR